MSGLDLSLQERQRLVSVYVTQYNQTNAHISRLFNTLDDIRHNINNLIGNNINMNNMHRNNRSSTQTNRASRQHHHHFNHSANTNANANINANTGLRSGPFIRYDYNNPIDRSTYITDFISDVITNNHANIDRHENNPHLTDFLTTFLNSSVPVRPTQQQINNASRLVRYDSIQLPNSTSCAISLEPFSSDDTVRQLHHCGHIFFPDEFTQWFSNNVRCPVCRHDIRNNLTSTTTTTTTSSTPTTSSSTTSTTTPTSSTSTAEQLTIDLSNNELSDNLISTISNRLFTSLLNPSSNPSDRFVYDPSNNVLLFETILRATNEQP
jgi:ribosome-binding factor A